MTVKSGASKASKSSFLRRSCSSEQISLSLDLKLLITFEKTNTFNHFLGQIGAGIAFQHVDFAQKYFSRLEQILDSEFDNWLDFLPFFVDSHFFDFDLVDDVSDHLLGFEQGFQTGGLDAVGSVY